MSSPGKGPNYNSFFNKYLVKSGRVSYFRLETICETLQSLSRELNTTRTGLLDAMKPIFNDDVIDEWMLEQIWTEENSLQEAHIAAKNHLATLK